LGVAGQNALPAEDIPWVTNKGPVRENKTQ